MTCYYDILYHTMPESLEMNAWRMTMEDRASEGGTACLRLYIPEMLVESLEKSYIRRWSLEVLSTSLIVCRLKSRPCSLHVLSSEFFACVVRGVQGYFRVCTWREMCALVTQTCCRGYCQDHLVVKGVGKLRGSPLPNDTAHAGET